MCKVSCEENLNIRLSYFYSLEFDTENGQRARSPRMCVHRCMPVGAHVCLRAWGRAALPALRSSPASWGLVQRPPPRRVLQKACLCSPKIHVEALTPSGMTLGGRALGSN